MVSALKDRFENLANALQYDYGDTYEAQIDNVLELLQDYLERPTEQNWDKFKDTYENLRKLLESVDLSLDDIDNDFRDGLVYIKETFEKMLEDYSAGYPEEVDYLLGLLEKYLADPIKENWDKFKEAYTEFLQKISRETEIGKIEDKLRKLADELSAYAGDYVDRIDELLNLLQKYSKNPTEKNWEKFKNAYTQFFKDLSTAPKMLPVIEAQPVSGFAPLSVVLNGTASKDPTNTSLVDENYAWSYIDNNGQEIKLDKKAIVTTEFSQPGKYVVNLRLQTANLDVGGKKQIFDGVASKEITVEESPVELKVKINGEEVETSYKVDTETAKKGLIFDISDTELKNQIKIEKVNWSFGDSSQAVERFDLDSLEHKYTRTGEYTLRIDLYDQLKQHFSKKVKIIVKDLVADFKIIPPEGTVMTEFEFDASEMMPYASRLSEMRWKITNAENKVITEPIEQNSFKHTFEEPGEYTVSLTLKNTESKQDTVTKKLQVVSIAPRAYFRWKIKNNAQPNVIVFDVTGSFDPDGDELFFDWDFDGDGQYDLKDSQDLTVEHVYDVVGKQRVILKVHDTYGGSDVMEGIISIDSVLGLDFKVEKYVVVRNEPLQFVAQAPQAISYRWDFGDGNVLASDARIEHTYTKAGKYKATLKVSNEEGDFNQVSKDIYVAETDSPLAVLNVSVDGEEQTLTSDLCGKDHDGVTINRRSRLLLKGDNSLNAEGEKYNLSYSWDLGDGSLSTDQSVVHFYDEILPNDACYRVILTVKDVEAAKVNRSEPLYIKLVNELPTLQYLEVKPLTDADELVTPVTFSLVAHGAKDVDGKILKYRWWYYKEGDTEKRGMKMTTDAFTQLTVLGDGLPGQENTYYFVVELTDNNNGVMTSSDLGREEIAFSVENGKNASPIVDFSVDKNMIYVGDSVNFFAKASDPSGKDVPKSAYKWDFDGDGEFDDMSSGSQVSRKYKLPGEYHVRLKVDLNGLSTTKTKTVYVEKLSHLPEAAFTYQVDGRTVSFDASNSLHDESLKDQTLWYNWDFDTYTDQNGNGYAYDDIQADTIHPRFTYKEDGEYTVRLTVRDTTESVDYVERKIKIGLKEINNQGEEISSEDLKSSLQVSSTKNLISTLDLFMPSVPLERSDTIDISARILLANGEEYAGKVYFRILEGEGDLIPAIVEAKGGLAITTFRAKGPGKIVVEAEAPAILGGGLKEKISFEVK